MKRVWAVLLALIISVVCSGFPVVADDSVTYTTRSDFAFGINVHDFSYNCYPEEHLDEQIHLVAKAGCKMIRINGDFVPDMSYLDTVVGLCNKYGLKIIMVLGVSKNLGNDYITNAYKVMAERYNGKNGRGFVDYIQAWNETDADLMTAKYDGSGTAGKKIDDYYTIPVDGAADLIEYTEYFKAAAKGIHEADSDTRFMINFCFTHWGTLLWYLEHGVKIDAVGWDYYPYKMDMTEHRKITKSDFDEYESDVYNKYKIPTIICETNTLNSSESNTVIKSYDDSQILENYDYLMVIMQDAYSREWMKGLIIYELLDEVNLTGKEGRWGMVDCERGGIIGEPKPIYRELQRLWGGSDNLPLIKKTTINLKPYEGLKVDTADDSGIQRQTNDDYNPEIETVDFDFGISDSGDVSDIPDLSDSSDTLIVEPIERTISTTRTISEVPVIPLILICSGIVAVAVVLIFLPKRKRKTTADMEDVL